MPRPRILNEAKQQEVCVLVQAGCTLAAAARYVGCSVLTIQREARRNHEFRENLRRKRMSAEMNPVRTLQLAAAGNWRAAAWLLERTLPQHYGKRTPDSFSREEVTELISRVCDVVRQEARDARQFARIKRRILTLTQKSIRPVVVTAELATPEVPWPTTTPAPDVQYPATNNPNPESIAHASQPYQNATNSKPVLISLADIPPGNSSTFAAQQ